ncbi:MAG: hypothetical protein IPJ78_18225 [Gemmatimonadetes bacterium]|nr:hypothetical protein [Gemmatimonadota bacterium]
MTFIRTRKATNWQQGMDAKERVVRALLFFIPQPDAAFRDSKHLVREWWVECGPSGEPWREIGLDAHGTPVYAAPDDTEYGYWCDTNMTLADFEGPEVSEAEFEAMWARTSTMRRGEVKSAAEIETGTQQRGG